jgi:hypothetical protein
MEKNFFFAVLTRKNLINKRCQKQGRRFEAVVCKRRFEPFFYAVFKIPGIFSSCARGQIQIILCITQGFMARV